MAPATIVIGVIAESMPEIACDVTSAGSAERYAKRITQIRRADSGSDLVVGIGFFLRVV